MYKLYINNQQMYAVHTYPDQFQLFLCSPCIIMHYIGKVVIAA